MTQMMTTIMMIKTTNPTAPEAAGTTMEIGLRTGSGNANISNID